MLLACLPLLYFLGAAREFVYDVIAMFRNRVILFHVKFFQKREKVRLTGPVA